MRGSFGFVIGVAIGAGAMYLVLRPPWEHRVGTVASSGPPVVIAGSDAGATKPVRKRRRTGGSASASEGAGEPAQVVLGAADRALEWRGDDVALPAQSIDMAAGGEARSLDGDEIRETIRDQAGGVNECVVTSATSVQGAAGTDLRATVTLKLLVDGRGRVTGSRVEAPHYLFEHGLLGCLQRAAGRLRFPATGGSTIVTLPVNLG